MNRRLSSNFLGTDGVRTRLSAGLAALFFVLPTAANAQEPPTAPPAETPTGPATEPAVPAGAPAAMSRTETTSPTAAPGVPSSDVVPNKQYPALGGHLGFAVPIATFSSRTTAIGEDFVTVGLTPGLTVHLDERWAIDFEFIAFNELKNTPAATTFVVDPGVIHKWDGFVAGLRVATQVGAPSNVGVVPIAVLPLKLNDKLVYFFELDLPLFLRDNPAIAKAEASATVLFQSGFGF